MNKLILLLFVTTVGFAAVTLHLVRELRAEKADVQQLQTQIAELQERLATEPVDTTPPQNAPSFAPPVAAAPASAPQPAAPAVASRAPAAPAAAMTEERMRMFHENMERQRALLRDPEYRDAMRTQHKTAMLGSYPDLAEELGLTPDEADRFLDLLADQQLRAMENQSPATFGPNPDPAATQQQQQKWEAWRQTVEQEQLDLLGHQKVNAWKEYQSGLGARHQVQQLGNALASKGAPLREDQIRPLRQAFAEAQRQMSEEWSRLASRTQLAVVNASGSPGRPDSEALMKMQEQQLRMQHEQTQRMRDALAPILTPEQLRHYEQQREAELKLQQAHLRMMRAQAEAEARGAIGPPLQDNAVFFEGAGIAQ